VLEASSLPQALPEIQNGAFDLVLIGLDLSDAKTVDALKSAAREASPATRIAIISASDTRADILASLAAGLHGFISKHQSDAAILDAIARLLSGRIYVPRSLAEADDGEASASRGDNVGDSLPTEADLLKLTKRQREVLGLLALGMSNKEIARALEIAEATTKIHIAALLRALGVRNRTEAAYKAGQLLNSAKLAPKTMALKKIGVICMVRSRCRIVGAKSDWCEFTVRECAECWLSRFNLACGLQSL